MLIEKVKKTAEKDGAEEAAAVLVPPDGGWGWMVVFGSFMIHLMADGMAYSFGFYVESFLHEFEATRSEVGFLGSLMLGVTLGSGPIASMLTNKYACRMVAILGIVIASFGFIIGIFAPNIYFMYFSFGIVAGLGLGFAYLPAIVAVSFYFEKRRCLAMGLAVCGSRFGTFIFAPLTQVLLEKYDWQGTVLIEAGLLLNCILCGAVFRPLETSRNKSVPLADKAEQGDTHELTEMVKISNAKAGSLSALPRTTLEPTPKPSAFASDRQLSKTPAPVIGLMDRKDILYTGSLQNIPMYKSDRAMYRRRVVSNPRSHDDDGCCRCCLCSGKGGSSQLMDCGLMIDPCFLLFAVSNLLTSFGYSIAYIFLPNRATVAGFTDDQAAFLISIIGIFDIIGRIVFGFMADYKWVNRLMLYNTVLVLCGLMSLLSALCYNYPLMAAYAASFGLFMGVYICLTPIVLIDLFGLDKLSNAFGIVLLFQGIGTFVGPPVAGAVYDVTEDYNSSFCLMGVCILVSGAMLYVIPCIQRYQHKTLRNGILATDVVMETSTPVAVLPPTDEEC